MNRKLKITLVTLFLPFLLVWAGFILTGFSYNPRDVFQSGPFWFVSGIYWFIWTAMIAIVIDEMK